MAKLSYRKRKRMPKRDFALASQRRGGKGGLPIEDERHGRAALSRASEEEHEGKITRSEEQEVERKVHRRYPDIGRRSRRSTGARRSRRGGRRSSR